MKSFDSITTEERAALIGTVIECARFGTPVQRSWNKRDGHAEPGMSCYPILNGVVDFIGWYFGFVSRPMWVGRGMIIGFGSDGEPLVRGFTGRRIADADKLDYMPAYVRADWVQYQ